MTTVQRGDVYALGDHRLMCGDRADMVFTDPPWGVAIGSNTSRPRTRMQHCPILNDALRPEDFRAFLGTTTDRMKEALKAGGMCYVVLGMANMGALMDVMEERGFHWSSTIVWVKRMTIGRKDYHNSYEPIWYGWEGSRPRLHPLADRRQTDVWEAPIESHEYQSLFYHPNMKPRALVVRAVENSSDPGALVLDPFGGSGTTLMACEATGRACRTMELSPEYCGLIIRRYEQETGKKAALL